MGQRSQIYIRIIDENNNITLIAKYFQWNYGERMISRAKYGIEYIKENLRYINQNWIQDKVSKIFNVNFDMLDIQLSTDIIKEVRSEFWDNRSERNNYIFEQQDNNDGKLFIECNQNSNEIKFCFTDYDLNILSPDEYMEWDMGENWTSPNRYSDEKLDKDWQEIIPICKANIESINANAKMMTMYELQEFIHDDYSKQIGESDFKKFLSNFVEKGMKYDTYWYFYIEKTDENGSWNLYNKDKEKVLIQYNNRTKGLIINEDFRKECFDGLIQDVLDYENIPNEKSEDKEDFDYDF